VTAAEAVTANDVAAEQAVLGAMMMSPQALATGLELLSGGDFWRPAHTVIFEAMASMDAAGLACDPLTLREQLDAHPENGRYGGAPYLHDLLESVPSVANLSYYAETVLEQSSRRRLAVAATRILQLAGEAGIERGDRADRAAAYLDTATGKDTCGGPVPLGELLPQFLEDLEAGPDSTPGVPVDWPALRPYLARLRPGEMLTVGGRPGTGKTSVLLGVAARAAIMHKIPSLFVSLEMTAQEVVQRVVAAKTRVPLMSIRNRTASDAELRRICDALAVLALAPLMITDDPFTNLNDIRGQLRSMRRRGGDDPGLLAVDYLQLMSGGGRPESRQLEIAEIARGLKLTAKAFGLPAIVGSQLNRSPEGRADKRPMLGDLRESGAVEQDSDVVLLLYRDKVYHPDATGSQVLEVIIAKQRNGPTGVVNLSFKDPYASVENLAQDQPEPPPPAPPKAKPPPLPYRPDDEGEEPLWGPERAVNDP
jgi:replicative DNA helicase